MAYVHSQTKFIEFNLSLPKIESEKIKPRNAYANTNSSVFSLTPG